MSAAASLDVPRELGEAYRRGGWAEVATRAAELARAEVVNPDAVELRTPSGDLVACVLVPAFPAGGPRLILWVTRAFVRELGNLAEYREVFAWTAPFAGATTPPPTAQD